MKSSSGFLQGLLASLMLLVALQFAHTPVLAAQPPSPPGLFRAIPHPPPHVKLPDTAKAGTGRFVDVEIDLLQQPTLPINLLDGTTLIAERKRLVDNVADNFVWSGRIQDEPNSQVVIALRNGVVGGSIRRGNTIYEVRALENGIYALFEVDESALPPHGPSFAPPPGALQTTEEAAAPTVTTAAANAATVIDLMIVYTPAARNASGQAGLESQIVAAVDNANVAYQNSLVNIHLNLVRLAEINYTESGNMSQSLSDLRGTGDGKMDEIHAWRNTYGADMVALISQDANYCGIAYVMTNVSSGFAPYAFSVTYTGCLSNRTLAHELGHNQGNYHDRANSLDANGNLLSGAYPYSYGYRVCGLFRTIMSYSCTGANRIDHFSNPYVSWNGNPTGIAHEVDPANSAEAARTLNNTAATIANFRQAIAVNPPSAPTGLTATASSSSQINLAWTDTANNESGFHIQRSTDGVNWAQIVTTGANVTSFSDTGLASSTTYHYRLYAFNSAGNSANSNVATATTSASSNLPSAPTNLTATAISSSQINLAWTDAANNESGFHIQQSTDGVNWTQIGTVGANVPNFNNTGLTSATTYNYRVHAFNSAGNSANSNVATATTSPSTVDTVANSQTLGAGTVNGAYTATHADDGATQFITERVSGGKPGRRYSYLEHTWNFTVPGNATVTFFANAYSGGSTDNDAFVFAYSINGGAYVNMFTVNSTSPATTNAFVLPAGTSGAVSVRVRDTNRAAGTEKTDTVYVDHLYIRSAALAAAAPAAATNLVATALSSSEISLSWSDTTDNEVNFIIERQKGAAWEQVGTTSSNTPTYTDSGLAASTTYTYRVATADAVSISDFSPPASATTAAGPIANKVHVGDLDGTASKDGSGHWQAVVTVTVHDTHESPVANATVSGQWNEGGTGGSCTTDASGQCTISQGNLKMSTSEAIFTISAIAHALHPYAADSNHDADEDSNGSIITVDQPEPTVGGNQILKLYLPLVSTEN